MPSCAARPRGRCLPGNCSRAKSCFFGVSTIVLGAAWLVLAVNGLSALIALATSILYLGAYTPLKTRTTLATAVGAIPGALPPLIGWAAATGSLSLGAWVLFANSVLLAVPAFHGHRLDVSRGLRAARES